MSVVESPFGPVDFSQWRLECEGEVRGPCPMLNALANHGILPRDGKGITKSIMMAAMEKIGVEPEAIGKVFDLAKPTIPKGRTTLQLDDLAKHGILEHNASISRQDFALGDNLHLDKSIWQTVMDVIGEKEAIGFADGANLRRMRFEASKAAHTAAGKPFDYGLMALVTSYVEMASLFHSLLEPGKTKVPVKYVRVFFEEARIPYKEGWRPVYDHAAKPSLPTMLLKVIWNNGSFWKELLDASRVSVGDLVGKILSKVFFWKRPQVHAASN